jgi:hypothetical protein
MTATQGYKTSKELVERLRQIADFLEAKHEFAVEHGAYLSSYDGKFSLSFDNKEKFVAAVRVLGDAEKHYTEGEYSELVISAKFAPIELKIRRDRVCRKVVKFECDPLFSAEELESL